MQTQTSIRLPDASTTLPLACPLSEASGRASISTGKERDTESGNDYFGARYYASSMGRWLSPDWSAQCGGPGCSDRLMLGPIVSVVVLFVLAFSEWPSLKRPQKRNNWIPPGH